MVEIMYRRQKRTMNSLWNSFVAYFQHHQHEFEVVAGKFVLIVILFLLARLLTKILLRTMHRVFNMRAVRLDERKRATLISLLDNVIRYLIYFIYILTILPLLGVHIATLLAGAGIAGLAIGFGAQNIIKDVLTGFFILFEDQYGVGDVVQINNFTGTVKTIGLRLTRIQAWTGEIEIIPNGQIQQVTNYSRNNCIAVVDVGISSDTDLKTAMGLLRTVLENVKKESSDVVGDVQILGVQAIGQSDLTIRLTAECAATTNSSVQRLIRQRTKEAFDKAGLKLPVPQTVVWMQPGSSNS